MDRKERYENLQVALMAALQGWQADLWTAMPGHIASFDPATQTCEVQPGLKLKITGPAIASLTPGADPTTVPEGSSAWMTLPKLQDCPVHFPSGGGYTLTFPVAVGDECLVVFGSRCIDSWWQSGGIQQQATMRMHDLSDGFVFVGFNSKPNVPSNICTDSVQLRSDAGTTVLDFKEGTVTLTAVNAVVNATNATVNASTLAKIASPSILLQNTGTALKSLLNASLLTWLEAHVHGNGNGGANTTAPTTTPASTTQTSVVQAE